MKKITSLILAMAMVFSLSAQVFALNDDMQDNENSEANMIVITNYIFRTYNITLEHWTYPPDFRS